MCVGEAEVQVCVGEAEVRYSALYVYLSRHVLDVKLCTCISKWKVMSLC